MNGKPNGKSPEQVKAAARNAAVRCWLELGLKLPDASGRCGWSGNQHRLIIEISPGDGVWVMKKGGM